MVSKIRAKFYRPVYSCQRIWKWGRKSKGRKTRKQKNIEDITLLAVLNCNIKSPQHYLIVFKPKYYYIGVIWGRKTNVF